jgi:hypothetical protein
MSIPSGSIIGFFDERDDEVSMLVGGFYIPKLSMRVFDNTVGAVKKKYGVPLDEVVKWNLRDDACSVAHDAIGSRVEDFRADIFNLLNKFEIRILMSFVWKGSRHYRLESWKWAFVNILQRLCIILDRKKVELKSLHVYPFLDVVFDMLPSNRGIDEYFGVYSRAYYYGYRNFGLPPLKDREACPCLLVTSARFSPALQVTDMVLGAVGEFFSWVFDKDRSKRESVISRHFGLLYPLFHRGADGSVLGCGLIVRNETKRYIIPPLLELNLEP